MLVHVTGPGRKRLPSLDGHLVRNLDWDRFAPESLDSTVDALVASAAAPGDAADLVARLREAGSACPVLLLTDDAPGWESVVSAFSDVVIVRDTVTLSAHLGATQLPDVQVPASEPARVIDLRRHVPRGGSRGLLRERLGEGTEQIGRSMRDFDRGLVREQPQARTAHPEPAEQVAAAVPPAAVDRSVSVEATSDRASSRRGRREQAGPDTLVAGLLNMAERLYGVRETGTAIAGHTKDSVGCDAAAVLVPDGALWVVVGAVGHRPLEERLSLGADHWLVEEVTRAHHGVVVEDTDIARGRLAGAPLAAWRHLMACPLPAVQGIVVLARSDSGPAFTSRDLAMASAALADADSLFSSALQLRELARRLITFAELDDA